MPWSTKEIREGKCALLLKYHLLTILWNILTSQYSIALAYCLELLVRNHEVFVCDCDIGWNITTVLSTMHPVKSTTNISRIDRFWYLYFEMRSVLYSRTVLKRIKTVCYLTLCGCRKKNIQNMAPNEEEINDFQMLNTTIEKIARIAL